MKVKPIFKKGLAMLSAVCILSVLSACKEKQLGLVNVYETQGTKSCLLKRQTDIEFNDYDGISTNSIININTKKKAQKISGFGAALTHSSAYVLNSLDDQTRNQILNELFSETQGSGFNLIRIPIGSSDYPGVFDGKEIHFTLDDVQKGETDESLENFNIDYDIEYLIPILKEIKAINPHIEIISTPWSAPAWMKDNDNLYGGALLEEYEDVYSEYIAKYVKAYSDEGIDISYITLQNEPLVNLFDYPCMQMDEYQQARLAANVGKKLEAKKLKNTKILAYDFNYSEKTSEIVKDYIDLVLSDKEASKYVAGVGFHGYENDGLDDFSGGFSYVKDEYKKISLITEITEGMWSVDFAGNLSYSLSNMVAGPINYGSAGTVYWNIALYDDGTPALGGSKTSLGIVSINKDGSYTKGAAYYAMSHISKFANESYGGKSVALESECDSPNLITCSLERGDGKIVTVVINTSDKFPEEVDIVYQNKCCTYSIQQQSAVTFVW